MDEKDQIPMHSPIVPEIDLKHWPRKPKPEALFDIDILPLSTDLKVDRELKTGSLLGFREVKSSYMGTAKTSTSMNRAPGPLSESVLGSATNLPFWPGGMDEINVDSLLPEVGIIDFENDLETVPPGFEYGMDFTSTAKSGGHSAPFVDVINMAKFLIDEEEFSLDLDSGLELPSEPTEKHQSPEFNGSSLNDGTIELIDNVESKVLSLKGDAPGISKGSTKAVWAELVDINRPVKNFRQQVPVMAYEYKFELDTFQKQAILHLERKENVFVAAHTSAGKTVVAEYAIALSMKHMTRTIYTSPIKALSNQKFRDFKLTFKDVGLLTGDVQIQKDAPCLIMTTEILRSMLYNGADIIRDLEWVIFDEVHYINDAERGVVWEEVLILLPKHVNIVLLSATVPNALQLADWIGRTKQNKIFVISTLKRPVPLEHYLYTGTDAKSKNELFKIVDATNKFLIGGYNAAKDAQENKKKNGGKTTGNPRNRAVTNMTLRQEFNAWLGILNMLKEKDQLPVVCFTLSRNLCDKNARMLTSVDFTSNSEKFKIKEFVSKSIRRLKETDQALPQVKTMQELLERGIAIHHSGILPMLKEVVELLFQDGLVKVLFATETFAMGVNMPTRTVIFNSIMKYDGHSKRCLRPEEYIQMAGRAGRRGLDPTGMVIIFCKNLFPERSELEIMIQGKPTILESRFRLTYSMILNLLRVNNLKAEDMMRRSFFEADTQKKYSHYEELLQKLQQKNSEMMELDCSICERTLKNYYSICSQYVDKKREITRKIMEDSHGAKFFVPGRVMAITTTFSNLASLATIVKVTRSAKNLTISALVALDSDTLAQPITYDKTFIHMVNAVGTLSFSEGTCKFDIVKCEVDDIIMLYTNTLAFDGDKVWKDWDKRQLQRFRDDPPSLQFQNASQELRSLIQKSESHLTEIDPMKDVNIGGIEFYEDCQKLRNLRERLDEIDPSSCAVFHDHFLLLYKNMKIKKEIENVQFNLSDDSLHLFSEYRNRVKVLMELGYIDETETVKLKGRVACEISNHELVITELVFENVLTRFDPPEIAALLSCMVFQEKRRDDEGTDQDISIKLKEGKELIIGVLEKIERIQSQCGVPQEDFMDQFKFQLVNVIYEWATGMEFAEIMKLTDVQEGIIVRCIQRLDEILRDVKDAARIVGDPVLYKKMEATSQAIKRDIVFAASLYTMNP